MPCPGVHGQLKIRKKEEKGSNKSMTETSKVYFADFRCPSWRENLPQKLARLMETAGFGDIDMDGKYVAK